VSSHPDKNAAALGIEPWPGKPCEFCTGNSAVVKRYEGGKPVYMTSAEWCERMNACAATIDWELIFSGR
jgi:hypothetical protein